MSNYKLENLESGINAVDWVYLSLEDDIYMDLYDLPMQQQIDLGKRIEKTRKQLKKLREEIFKCFEKLV